MFVRNIDSQINCESLGNQNDQNINQNSVGASGLPECAAKLVVVHVWFALALSPLPGHFVRVGEFELAVPSLPDDTGGVLGRVGQQLQQKLPQLDLTGGLTGQPQTLGAGLLLT